MSNKCLTSFYQGVNQLSTQGVEQVSTKVSTMHSTHDEQAIATTKELNYYLEHQNLQVYPASKQVKTPQRKAKYSDQDRIRLKEAKKWALVATGCFSTVEVKYWLKKLGIKLDLRLTAAWVAIWKELATQIKAIRSLGTNVPSKANCFAQVTYDIYPSQTSSSPKGSPKSKKTTFFPATPTLSEN